MNQHDDHDAEQASQESIEESVPEQAGTDSRRSALKKAAAAGVVGAAVFAAPKVEGMSIAPNYAAAGTGTTGLITLRLNGNGPGLLGANNFMNAAPSPQYTITQNGPSDNQAIILTAPLGAAGNAVWTFPGGLDTDGPAIPGGSVAFNVDPPYNNCRIISGNTGWQGSTGGRPTLSNTAGPAPVPNNVAPFTQTIGIPAGGESPYYNPSTAINFIEIRIQCT
jgi:hypothetical protein